MLKAQGFCFPPNPDGQCADVDFLVEWITVTETIGAPRAADSLKLLSREMSLPIFNSAGHIIPVEQCSTTNFLVVFVGVLLRNLVRFIIDLSMVSYSLAPR